jgi:hypothetical protein
MIDRLQWARERGKGKGERGKAKGKRQKAKGRMQPEKSQTSEFFKNLEV